MTIDKLLNTNLTIRINSDILKLVMFVKAYNSDLRQASLHVTFRYAVLFLWLCIFPPLR